MPETLQLWHYWKIVRWIKNIFFTPVFGCRCESISRRDPETTTQFPVVIERWQYPFPSRTRKSSTSSPMVLYGSLYGRVGRCRDIFAILTTKASLGSRGGFFVFISSSLNAVNLRKSLQNILIKIEIET